MRFLLKMYNLLRSIEKTVMEQSAKNPYLISIGQRAEIVSMIFKQRQKDTKETLEDIKDIIEDMNTAEKERAAKKMSSEIFSVYWTLRTEGLNNAENVAKDTNEVFGEYPYWKNNSEQERKLKGELYKILIKNKVLMKKAVEIGSKILNDLKRAEK